MLYKISLQNYAVIFSRAITNISEWYVQSIAKISDFCYWLNFYSEINLKFVD